MLLPNMTESYVNLSFGNHLGRRKACGEFKQESLAQLSLAIKLCFSYAMSLPWTTPCWLLTLSLPLLAIPPLHSAYSYHPIYTTWNFTLVVWSVMVLWVATNGATMKPIASCGWPTQGCAARHALVTRFLVLIHCRITPMCYFHMSFSLVISPYPVKRSIYQTKSNRDSF